MAESCRAASLADVPDVTEDPEVRTLREALQQTTDDYQRAECMATIQADAVQLALDLLVAAPDLRAFFRAFIGQLVEESEAHSCGVWLLDEASGRSALWLANVRGDTLSAGDPGWAALDGAREGLESHLTGYEPGWSDTIEYRGDDTRLPEAVRAFNAGAGVRCLLVAPLRLASRTLGWMALSATTDSACERTWWRALLEATARQATMALQYTRLLDQSRLEERQKAVLEERNRIARDIHDTLAQGFAAIQMQLQVAQRAAGDQLPPDAARSLATAVELARSHMVEARRSVAALRPHDAAPVDVVAALQRMTDLAGRTGGIPVDLTIDDLPAFDAGVEREVLGIAQEALTNAVRHARARHIEVRAGAVRGVGFRLSVADDGRGLGSDRRSDGFGLTSMRERAERIGASLTFVTAPRAGTEVVLAWQPASFSIPRAGLES